MNDNNLEHFFSYTLPSIILFRALIIYNVTEYWQDLLKRFSPKHFFCILDNLSSFYYVELNLYKKIQCISYLLIQTEKEALQYEMEHSLKEKAELASENEFLLQDNNELHENLTQLVHELERMQDKFKATQVENEELKHSVEMVGNAEDVVRLLEERNILQQRCSELEASAGRMQVSGGNQYNTVCKMKKIVSEIGISLIFS